MSEVMRRSIIDIDLTKPLKTEQCGTLIASKDSNANKFGVNVYAGGTAVSLAGCTVKGTFVRPDRQVVELTGSTTGNQAFVTLNANCYAYSGRFTLTIKIEKTSGLCMTVRIVNGFVYATVPGSAPIVPDNPDVPSTVSLSVDYYGNATVQGAVLTVDDEGNATLSGVAVDGNSGANIG